MDPLDQTITTYREHFSKYVERTPQEPGGEFMDWMNAFAECVQKQGRILELGSAFGRDARYFAKKGFRMMCTDVIPQALAQLKDEGFETAAFDFRDPPKPEWVEAFDGCFANAVLLHASRDVFVRAVEHMILIVKENGIIAFSLKAGEGELVTLEKMDAPRYFCYHTEAEVRSILAAMPVELIRISQADNGKWLQVIAKKNRKG